MTGQSINQATYPRLCLLPTQVYLGQLGLNLLWFVLFFDAKVPRTAQLENAGGWVRCTLHGTAAAAHQAGCALGEAIAQT